MPSILNATTSSGLVTSADNSGSLQLATNSGTTAVTIDTSQNVGIGTASPNADSAAFAPVLSVKGGSFDGVCELIGSRADGSATGVGQLRFVQNANTTGKTISYIQGETEGATANNRGGNLQFWTKANAGSLAERMRIDSSGALLVGTTTADGRISAETTGNVITSKQNGAGGWCYKSNAFNNAGTRYQIEFLSDGNSAGSITSGASTTTYGTTSDYRLKKNVAPMTGALDKVQALKPVTYTWVRDGADGQGFIAHELQAVVPDCVVGKKDAVDTEGNPVYQVVDTSFLVATLTAAIQELNAKVDAQALEIQALKGVA
jgi:hypothetical protein